MSSFSERIKQNTETKAYLLGADAYSDDKIVICPFSIESQAYKDWQDGFQDAAYLRGLYENSS
jgi:hypothetical protein